MKSTLRSIAVIATLGAFAWACSDDDCKAGESRDLETDKCYAPPQIVAGGAADASTAHRESGSPGSIGATCSSASDCGPTAPECGAPQLPYCTQIDCKDGEANAGACPTGFTCQEFSGFPSFCMRD